MHQDVVEASVDCPAGQVTGRVSGGVLEFRGIPYAEPIGGDKRFAPAILREPFAEPFEAVRFSKAPLQEAGLLLRKDDIGDDSLSLNIWTPGTDEARRPVMVWIHGGGYVTGAGSQPMYKGKMLAAEGDVVVVTLNYRLGALGFAALSLLFPDDSRFALNNGLKDQQLALEWIQQNIAAFGGDPGNITLFGESAGAMAISCHLASGQAGRLFHRAILQSGSGDHVISEADGIKVAETFLQALEIRPYQRELLFELPDKALLKAQRACYRVLLDRGLRQGRTPQFGMGFMPVIEAGLVPDVPVQCIARGSAAGVPVLAGYNEDEWKLFTHAPQLTSGGGAAVRELDEDQLVRAFSRSLPHDHEQALQAYREWLPERSGLDQFCAMETDRMFAIPTLRLLQALSRAGQPAWGYRFAWESPFADGQLGACHALEIPFVFGTIESPMGQLLTGNQAEVPSISQVMRQAWAAFARNGIPEATGNHWPVYLHKQERLLGIGQQIEVEENIRAPRESLWNKVIPTPSAEN